MKKLPLAIAALSFFAASSSFSQQYNQDFEVSLNVPSNVEVMPLYREVVNLDMNDLSQAMNSDGTLIGSMNIQTTASHCYAKVWTDNTFKLIGPMELPYTVDYIAANTTGSSMVTQFGADPYAGYNDMEKTVGCNTGDLKMRLSRMENGMQQLPNGIYNDVIHVEVRAES